MLQILKSIANSEFTPFWSAFHSNESHQFYCYYDNDSAVENKHKISLPFVALVIKLKRISDKVYSIKKSNEMSHGIRLFVKKLSKRTFFTELASFSLFTI